MRIGNDPREALWREWMKIRKFKAGRATAMKNILDFADFRAARLAELIYPYCPSVGEMDENLRDDYARAQNEVCEVILRVENNFIGKFYDDKRDGKPEEK